MLALAIGAHMMLTKLSDLFGVLLVCHDQKLAKLVASVCILNILNGRIPS